MTTKIPVELSSTPGIVDGSNATAITIDSSERVGIGTTSPSSLLHIVTTDNTDTLVLESTDADANTGPVMVLHRNSSSPAEGDLAGEIRFDSEDTSGNQTTIAKIQGILGHPNHGESYAEDGRLTFSIIKDATLTEVMRLSEDARVAIGTTDPATQFHVETTASPIATFRYNASNRIDVRYDGLDIYGGAFRFLIAGTEKMRLGTGGRTTYNGSSTANGHGNYVGEVGSNSKAISFEHTNGGGEVGSITTGSSSTAFNTSSDYRLKENVDYTWDATTRLKQLKPARFNFIIDETNTLVDGFLAHEVSSIVPEAITGDKDAVDSDGNPEYQGIDQSKLVPLLVKTIQELEARITTLEGE